MAKQQIPWDIVIYGALALVAYKVYQNWAAQQAVQQSYMASVTGAGVSAPSQFGPIGPSGQSLDSVVSSYLAQQLQETSQVNQAIMQQALQNVVTQQPGGTSGGTGFIEGSNGFPLQNPAQLQQGIQDLQNITQEYDVAPNSTTRAALHPVAQSIRDQLAAQGAGQLVYNPKLGYAQLEYAGKFY